ncbi:MAG: D-alanyl-lipoteichoic acid biosynthesis protein DltD [Ferruginibacter sp.]
MKNIFLYRMQKSGYGKLLLNGMLFLALVFMLDWAIGSVLRYYYFKQTSGLLYRTTYSIEKTTSPLLVMGSSRANHHYDPSLLSKNLGKEAYNTGRDGNYIFYNYAVLKCILKRYTPSVIIYDFTLSDLQAEPDSYDRLSSLLPYYQKHPEVRPVVELRSPFEKVKLVSGIYPFNSLLFTIMRGNNASPAGEENETNGFIPLDNHWNKPIAAPLAKDNIPTIDSTKVKYFKMYIDACQAAGIKLYMVFSPVFINYTESPKALQEARKVLKEKGVVFYDFSADSSFTNHPEFFSDPVHLNKEGARKFSDTIGTLIQ